MDKTKLARHVSGNNSAHLQEHYTVHYSLWYVVPNMLMVGDLVTEFLRHQITDRQRIEYNIPHAVVYSLMFLRMSWIVTQNMLS